MWCPYRKGGDLDTSHAQRKEDVTGPPEKTPWKLGRCCPKPRDACSYQKPEEAGSVLPYTFQRERGPADTLVLDH